MTTVTPVAERLRDSLKKRFYLIDRDKLTRWQMARSSNKDLEIIDCRGRRISPGLGCDFSGQLRENFWRFVRPCIEDAIQECCDELENAFERYTQEQRLGTIKFVEAALKAFVGHLYRRMVELDRAMRGKGYPKSVESYNPAREIKSANELIDYKLGVIEKHYCETGPRNPIFPKLRVFGLEVDLAAGRAWLKARVQQPWLHLKTSWRHRRSKQ